MRNNVRREKRIARFLFKSWRFIQGIAAQPGRACRSPAGHLVLRGGEPAQYELLRMAGRDPAGS
jgi:hypothetical protein